MNKKLVMITIATMIVTLFAGLVSAVVPNVAPYGNGIAYGYASYGSAPINPQATPAIYYPYESQPVRIGGFFGGNSFFLHGLKPGFFDSPQLNYGTRNHLSSQYYPRAGGSYTYGTYNLRPSVQSYGYTGLNGGYGGYKGGYGSYGNAPLPNTFAY